MNGVPNKPPDPEPLVEILTPCIRRNGRLCWHPRWHTERAVYRFFVPLSKYKGGGGPT